MHLAAMLLVFAVAFGAAVLLTPLAAGAGMRLGFIDRPRRGEVQRKPIARSGGYALFAAFALAVAVSVPLLPRYPDEYARLAALALGSLLLLPIALIDDARRLGPLPQLIGQVLVAVVPLFFGVAIDSISNPFGGTWPVPDWLIVPLSLFWIVGMINTLNFWDTMDGLASGVGMIGAIVLFLVSFQLGQFSIAALPVALAGACAGFLVFNFHPARVFMGSSGSMFIGYALALLAFLGGAKIAATAMVLGIPILDVAWVIAYRLHRGRSPFAGGDAAHLPHRLLAVGLSQRQVALLLYGLCLLFGLLAVFLTHLQKLYAMGLLVLVLVGLLVFLAQRRPANKGAERQPRINAD